MISVADQDTEISHSENLPQCIVKKTLLLNRKGKYKELRDSQRYRNIIIRKPGSHKYKFEFELSVEDTALTEMYLYQKNFSQLPRNTVFLWVCSVRKKKSKYASIINCDDLDWHFAVVETDKELNCKHKGIISKLKKSDLLLSAGEMYCTDTHIEWNNMTGALKKNMDLNEKNLGESFIEHVLTPIFNRFPEKFSYKADIIKIYAPKITYDYCNKLYKNDILTYSNKEKICSC
jgi:hypothetical protein